MDFLKEILGEELFKQFSTAVNAYNGNEANKDKQIKLANLAGGEYVGKGKYDALQEALNGKDAELVNANNLIEQMKKATKGNEDLQGKITQYESTVAELQNQLQETKIKSAIKVALLSEKAVDVDYLTFKLNEKLKEKGETLELDENENIVGWDNKLEGLKVQFPTMFSSESGGENGLKILDPNKLKQADNRNVAPTKSEFSAMTYEQRVALKQQNEQLYRQLKNN